MVKCISLVLLIAGLAICSVYAGNNRLSGNSESLKLIKQQRQQDSLKVSQIKRDIVLYRQDIMKAINDLDIIALRVQNGLLTPSTQKAAEVADSTRMKALHNYKEVLHDLTNMINSYASDSLITTRDQINTISFQEIKTELDKDLREVTNFINGLETTVTNAIPETKPEKAVKENKEIPQETAIVVEKANPEAQRDYENAKIFYDNGDYEGSIDLFVAFLKKYPKQELAPNAQYWLGEAFYSTKNYQRAIKEFEHVTWKYPDSKKAADAQFKIGLSYLELKNKSKARQELEKVKNQYPDYERIDQVNKYLSGLK